MPIVEGAGGKITNWSGESLKWLPEIGIIYCLNGIWMGSSVLGNGTDTLIISKTLISDSRLARTECVLSTIFDCTSLDVCIQLGKFL